MRRRKDHLIPLEKSRKVIYLEKRGRETSMSVGSVIFAIIAVACLLYCLSIFFFMGYGSRFFLIWGVMAAVFGAMSVILAHKKWLEKIPVWFKMAFVILCLIGMVFFLFVEGLILSGWNAAAGSGADYVIVLGAQWKSNGPSYVLQKRLDKALEYLRENPDTLVIVSGGQGANEPISEAEGMKQYLEERGIEEERILVENTSTSTYENLLYSSKLIDKEGDRVVLVSNNFHMYRAMGIARKQGYKNLEGLSAKSYPGMVPNNLLREFFGVVKECMTGTM